MKSDDIGASMARRAYETYCLALTEGATPGDWERLSPMLRDAWEQVCAAVTEARAVEKTTTTH